MNKVEARRRILQGSLSAPVILTVSSASVAATTSFTKCIANGVGNQPDKKINIQPTTDTWFRCPVTVYAIYQGDGTKNLYGNFYLDGSTYKNVTDGSILPLHEFRVGASSTWYRLVYFGTDGSPMGAGWERQSGGYAITLSCGGSFAVCQ